jgi:hypothetical protein
MRWQGIFLPPNRAALLHDSWAIHLSIVAARLLNSIPSHGNFRAAGSEKGVEMGNSAQPPWIDLI